MPRRPAYLDNEIGPGPTVSAVGAGGAVLIIFSCKSFLFSLPLS